MVKGLELLREVCADVVKIFDDSMLVINQLAGIYECRSEILVSYYERCLQLLKELKDFCLEHILQLHNEEANRLAQHAWRYQLILEVFSSAVNDEGQARSSER